MKQNFVNEISHIVELLKSGKIIIYPTDTIWGIGCDATVGASVAKIYEIKKRADHKSLIILVSDIEMLKDYVEEIPPLAIKLMNETKIPLTIIFQNAKNLAKNAIASDGSIAIRIPNDEFCKTLISSFGKPIISTSANFSGQKPPANFSEIDKNLLKKADYVVKYRQDDVSKSKSSTIVKIEDDKIIYLRN